MSDIVKRVATAMRDASIDACDWIEGPDEIRARMAIAAIKALREPSEAMVEGARCVIDSAQVDEQIARIYRAMIDAALA